MAAAAAACPGAAESPEHSDDRLAAAHRLAGAHGDLRAARHVAVGAGAETDHAVALARRELVPGPQTADDAPRDDAGDLHGGHARVLALQANGVPLVDVGVLVVGRLEGARRVEHVGHHAG